MGGDDATMLPMNWRKVSTEEIEDTKNAFGKVSIFYQGNINDEPRKCSYCESTKIIYKGSVYIGSGVGTLFYLACEKCHKKFLKMEQQVSRGRTGGRTRGDSSALSSKWGNYMHGSGSAKGGLNTDGRGLSG